VLANSAKELEAFWSDGENNLRFPTEGISAHQLGQPVTPIAIFRGSSRKRGYQSYCNATAWKINIIGF
jgi:hypothetical protein